MKKVQLKVEIEFKDSVSESKISEITAKVARGIVSQAVDTSEGLAPDDDETYTEMIVVQHENGVKSVAGISIQGIEILTTDENGDENIS